MIPTDPHAGHIAAMAFALIAPRLWQGDVLTDDELDEIRREAEAYVF